MEDVKGSWTQAGVGQPYLYQNQQYDYFARMQGILQEVSGPLIDKNYKIINGHVEKIDSFHSYLCLEARKLMSMDAFFPLIKQDYIKTHWLRIFFFKSTESWFKSLEKSRKLAAKTPREMKEQIIFSESWNTRRTPEQCKVFSQHHSRSPACLTALQLGLPDRGS